MELNLGWGALAAGNCVIGKTEVGVPAAGVEVRGLCLGCRRRV